MCPKWKKTQGVKASDLGVGQKQGLSSQIRPLQRCGYFRPSINECSNYGSPCPFKRKNPLNQQPVAE